MGAWWKMIIEALMLIGSMCGNHGNDSRFCKARWNECLDGVATKVELRRRGSDCTTRINQLDICLEESISLFKIERMPISVVGIEKSFKDRKVRDQKCWDEYYGRDLGKNDHGGPAH